MNRTLIDTCNFTTIVATSRKYAFFLYIVDNKANKVPIALKEKHGFKVERSRAKYLGVIVMDLSRDSNE